MGNHDVGRSMASAAEVFWLAMSDQDLGRAEQHRKISRRCAADDCR